MNPIRYPNVEITGMRGSRSEIVEDSPAVRVVEAKIHVAVGKEVKEGELTLAWTLHNSGGRKICILHVHQPADRIPIMGTKFQISQLEEHQVRTYHECERQNMLQLLDKYSKICERAGVRAEILHIEKDSIEKGIVELISQHGIRRLVMGAAANKLFSTKMLEPKSKKAIYVHVTATTSPLSYISVFILMYVLHVYREGRLNGVNIEVASPLDLASPKSVTRPSSSFRSSSVREWQNDYRSTSVREWQNDHLMLRSLAPDLRRARSDTRAMNILALSSPDGAVRATPCSISHAEESSDESDGLSGRSPSLGSHFSTGSSSEAVDESILNSLARTVESGRGLDFRALPDPKEDLRLLSLPSEGSTDEGLYEQLEQIMVEAENSKREAFEESIRRRKAEKDAIEAIRRAKASENSYTEEFRQRKEVEDVLARGKEKFGKMKQQLEEVMKELQVALEQKSFLENQIANSDQMVQELEEKIFSAVELLQNYKNERDELQVERDDALREAEDLRRKQAEESSSMQSPQFSSEFSFFEIEEATKKFDPSLKIGDGGYGSIYKGLLRHALVAIKKLHSHSSQGPSEYQQEVFYVSVSIYDNSSKVKETVKTLNNQKPNENGIEETAVLMISSIGKADLNGKLDDAQFKISHVFIGVASSTTVNILSKLRHPNLVTLIGACPEAWILVYEYLPNGSLEDRLNCRDNTPPLSWQTRIRIATELCSALIFLHSCSPHSVIHGDLKPANVLLDAHYVCKLSDFGICRVLSQDFSSNNTTLCCRTDPKGTFAYIDPEFLSTGELTSKSDVYSFGVILLRLLTGRPALGIVKEVQSALDNGNLKNLLDATAGDWPFVQAKQLAHLAMSCCEVNRRIRPDLVAEVWRVLEPMRVSCGALSFRLGSDERCQISPYFVCPIFQEVMQDPVVAADGFTYEAEALKGWLDSGHDTSPMTNLKLANSNLLPNHALRSAIQEWLQQP
ncbi:hypothetical protein RJ639_045184 [Escallonia herrerae]|uniref:RING-type E3 ubiquitin transferase n=1 Tax=Escallonia herrerae TaxID=1293975 RepID=A0AA88W9L8_9ASTE|nr:hypothetical protein RJ639_045184 [Escallonia herrerae]